MPNFDIIPYNDIAALENEFIKNSQHIAAYMCDIQGEAGVIIPDQHY